MICSATAINDILEHGRRVWPDECCGLLIGSGDRILEAVPIRNVAGDSSRYLLDPKEHIDARRDARGRGLEVIGFYHSHPRGAPEPSPRDLEEAAYPDHVHLIVSVRGADDHSGDAGLFQLRPDGCVRLPMVVA